MDSSNDNDTFLGIGKILSNLLSLEFSLRLFLDEIHKTNSNEQDQSFDLESLCAGALVPKTPFTNYDTLGKLIEKVNTELGKRNDLKELENIDSSVVRLRDALAYGRVFSLQPNGPLSVIKFSKPSKGKVMVQEKVNMTPEWFKEKIEYTRNELNKIIRLAKKLGLSCFPNE